MKQEKQEESRKLKPLTKVDDESNQVHVRRQATMLVDLNKYIRERMIQDHATVPDIVGVLNMALHKLLAEALDKTKGAPMPETEEQPSYFG